MADRWWQGSEAVAKEIIAKLGKRRCDSSNWSYDVVKYSISAGIAQVKLDDQATGNGLTNQMTSALTDIAVELHNRPDVKAVAFTAGGFYFCTGGAFGAGVSDDDAQYGPQLEPGAGAFEEGVAGNIPTAMMVYLLNTMPQYKVASIRGGNLGAGISIIASMDYVVAPERKTGLSFKEATRGLAACTSWQGIVSKLGVLKMRKLCLLAEDLDANQAKELGVIDELIEGPVATALRDADSRALAKAKEVARLSTEERQQQKTTGPDGCPTRLAPLPAAVHDTLRLKGQRPNFEAAVEEVLNRCGRRGRPPMARLSRELWTHEAVRVEMAGQHVAMLSLRCDSSCSLDAATLDGLLDALAELHRSVGRVRLVHVRMEANFAGQWGDCPTKPLQEALFLLYMLPMYVLGSVEGTVAGLGLVLCSTFDSLVAKRSTCFDFSGLTPSCPGVNDFLRPRIGKSKLADLSVAQARKSAEDAKAMGLVSEIVDDEEGFQQSLARACEKASQCAPNAVAQSKAFIQKIGSSPMEPVILEELCGHIARRQMDPEFADSIRAVVDKEHLPMYSRPNSRVVPEHLMVEQVKASPEASREASSGYPAGDVDEMPQLDDDGTVLI